MNERWCVRCGREGATPFLRTRWKDMLTPIYGQPAKEIQNTGIMDIGCGNGRNLRYLHEKGFRNTVGFDMVNDCGYQIALGKEKFPLLNGSVSVILANYVFMFLSAAERHQVIKEIKRVASWRCRIMVELYPAKDSETPTDEDCTRLQNKLIEELGWKVIVNNKHRFIVGRA